jgi:hypothetical protein
MEMKGRAEKSRWVPQSRGFLGQVLVRGVERLPRAESKVLH